MQYDTKLRLQVDTPYEVDSISTYIIVSYHRGNPTQDKSVWDDRVVSYHEEIQCFINALKRNWVSQKENKIFCWGIQCIGGIQRIGIGTIPERKELFIAQFKTEINSQWHGFPIDYTNSHYKVPSTVLDEWWSLKIISKSQKSKMKRCIECL